MAAAKIHLSLNVANVERSAAWYEAFFGMAAHKRRPGYANFDLDSPPLKLALQERGGQRPPSLEPSAPGAAQECGPLNHLGILVPTTKEVEATKNRLETAGLVTFSEENVTCCYALQDKIWVRDPDGNAWEVYALLDEQEDEEHDHPTHERDADAGSPSECGSADPSGCCG